MIFNAWFGYFEYVGYLPRGITLIFSMNVSIWSLSTGLPDHGAWSSEKSPAWNFANHFWRIRLVTAPSPYTHNGILLSHKKEWNNAVCSNMDRPRDYHTKWSKSDRKRQISYDITYFWNLKNVIKMNLLTKQKLTHRHIKQTYGYQRGLEGEKINQEFGINITHYYI